jgi:hypothetical protein
VLRWSHSSAEPAGSVEIANTELYDAMMTNHGVRPGQFAVEATERGVRSRIVDG